MILNFARAAVVVIVALGWFVISVNTGEPQELPLSVVSAVALLFGKEGFDLVKGIKK